MATYHLYKWSVIPSRDPYIAPDLNPGVLVGHRADDPREITTSRIVKAEGRTITTLSGSVYILEDIDPDYLLWLNQNNIPYNHEQPITVKKYT